MKELELIDWIRQQVKLDPAVVAVGPGDDCAELLVGAEKLLVTTDQVLDGVHFVLAEHGPEAAGRKAMARNLSDVAAMAAVPLAAVATVALPRDMIEADVHEMHRGMRLLGEQFHCPIVGGDISIWPGPLAISMTVMARPSGVRPLLRSGARAGDAVCVTGSLGGGWAGQRHLTFTPRLAEARTLASRYNIHAMIDLSDGLASDLGHICRASGVGATINAPAVPVHEDARLSRPDDPLTAALCDGEDYELLFTLPADQADAVVKDRPLAGLVRRVGTMTAGPGIELLDAQGQSRPMPAGGWEHKS
jgi:thiamine-monophosphate kinase